MTDEQSLAQLKGLAFAVSAIGFGLAAANAAIAGAQISFFVLMPAVGACGVLIGGIALLFDARIGSLLLKVSSILAGCLWLFCTVLGTALPLTLVKLATDLRDHSFHLFGFLLALDAWLPLPCLLYLYIKSSDIRDRIIVSETSGSGLAE